METTQVRISKALNERLKATLANARNRIPVGQAIERLLTEALDYAEGKPVTEPLTESLRAQLNVESTVGKVVTVDTGLLGTIEDVVRKILAEKGIDDETSARVAERPGQYKASKRKA